jgi:hypothetical protein
MGNINELTSKSNQKTGYTNSFVLIFKQYALLERVINLQ